MDSSTSIMRLTTRKTAGRISLVKPQVCASVNAHVLTNLLINISIFNDVNYKRQRHGTKANLTATTNWMSYYIEISYLV